MTTTERDGEREGSAVEAEAVTPLTPVGRISGADDDDDSNESRGSRSRSRDRDRGSCIIALVLLAMVDGRSPLAVSPSVRQPAPPMVIDAGTPAARGQKRSRAAESSRVGYSGTKGPRCLQDQRPPKRAEQSRVNDTGNDDDTPNCPE